MLTIYILYAHSTFTIYELYLFGPKCVFLYLKAHLSTIFVINCVDILNQISTRINEEVRIWMASLQCIYLIYFCELTVTLCPTV